MDEKSRVPGEVGQLTVGQRLVGGVAGGRRVAEPGATSWHVVERMLLLWLRLLLMLIGALLVLARVDLAGGVADRWIATGLTASGRRSRAVTGRRIADRLLALATAEAVGRVKASLPWKNIMRR